MPVPVRGYYNVKDYGARGNGTTDDVAALNAALDAANGNDGIGQSRYSAVLHIPRGVYPISEPFKVRETNGLVILADPGATLLYTGDPGATAVVELEGMRNQLLGLTIRGEAQKAIHLYSPTFGGWITTANRVAYCDIDGTFADAIAVDYRGGATSANNEYHRIHHNKIRGYGRKGSVGAGIRLYGVQVHVIRIDHNDIQDVYNTRYSRGIYAEWGAYLRARGNTFRNHYLDIDLSTSIVTNEVSNNTSVGSAHFVLLGLGGSGAGGPLVIRGNYVDHQGYLGLHNAPVTTNPHSSVESRMAGPMTIKGNYIRASNRRPVIFGGGAVNTPGHVVFGNMFEGDQAYPDHMWTFEYTHGGLPATAQCVGATERRLRTVAGSNLYGVYGQQNWRTVHSPAWFTPLGLMDARAINAPRSFDYVHTFTGGEQEYQVTLDRPEIDDNYDPIAPGCCIVGGDTTAQYTVTTREKDRFGFKLRLNQPASSSDVQVGCFIVRRAAA